MTLTAAHWRLWPLSRNFYYLPSGRGILKKNQQLKAADCAHGRAVNKLRSGKDFEEVHSTKIETETETGNPQERTQTTVKRKLAAATGNHKWRQQGSEEKEGK